MESSAPSCSDAGISASVPMQKCSPVLDQCWSVPVAMAAAAFLLFLPSSSFGLFYVLFMEKFGVSREEASWPQSVASMVAHLSGILAFVLQRFLNSYQIVLLSTVFATMGLVTSAFATNMVLMAITFGFLNGFGYGLFTISATVYTLPYFDKYQGVATSLKFVTWGLAGVISPFVVTRLVDTYALSGALLILGGLLMQTIPIVMLTKNPSSISIWKLRANTYSVKTASFISRPRLTAVESPDLGERTIPQPNGLEAGKNKDLKRITINHALALFRMPAFYVLLVAAVAGDYVAVEFLSTIVDYGVDKGLALDKAKQLTMFTSLGELFGRLVIPVLTDFLPFSRRPLYAVSLFGVFVCMTVMPHVSSFPAVVALAVMEGVAQGYGMCIKYVLVAECLGVERTAACFGVVGVATIPLSLVSPTIIGVFRDARGSYDDFYRMLGGFALAAALIFAVFAFWNRTRRNLKSDKE
ncbi:monocarboxylate transporter 12-like [Amblyomma americanum]